MAAFGSIDIALVVENLEEIREYAEDLQRQLQVVRVAVSTLQDLLARPPHLQINAELRPQQKAEQ